MSLQLVRAAGLVLVPIALGALGPRVATAQSTGTIRGRVTETGTQRPVPEAQVVVVGATTRAITNAAGDYVLVNVPAGSRQVQARRIGFAPVTETTNVTAGATSVVNLSLSASASQLDQVVVTALGQVAQQRTLGVATQSVGGTEVAETQRPNFVNALQGRIAGVEVTSSSGVPGASSSITIRGVSSISGSNQPLFIIDGVPLDNKTTNTAILASDAPGSTTAFNNRGLDFSNRASDLNPEDIENITVLKGPEAAALYGLDAANGAIVITTKRGRPGTGGLEYSNTFRVEALRHSPEVQQVYGPTAVSGGLLGEFRYFGAPFAAGTQFYDNIGGFFQDGSQQTHNLIFSGAAPDNRVNYRVSSSYVNQVGVVPGSQYRRVNLNGTSSGQVAKWLRADLSMIYANTDNDQPFKGDFGSLIGVLLWPSNDNAADWLTPAGTRRRITNLTSTSEVDNPYFQVRKNYNSVGTNRIFTNLGLIFTPVSWGNLKTNLSVDNYADQGQIQRHPESATAFSSNGILDEWTSVTRNINGQAIFNFTEQKLIGGWAAQAFVGTQVVDNRYGTDALAGQDYLDPNFVSINNTNRRFNQTSISRSRRVGAFGQLQFNFHDYLYLTAQGRNDWTSTIPKGANSFFYPSFTGSFVFSDAFPSVKRFVTGKVRAAYAEVGQDARPYADRPALQYKATAFGGYGYNFTGPNPFLKPEFRRSTDFGVELSFLGDRLGLDVSRYDARRTDQIVNDIRGSYATGFILFNLNGAETRNRGVEVSLRGTPVRSTGGVSWDFIANFDRSRGRTIELPNALPESYVSDTWLYGNVRNGTAPGLSTRSLTGRYYVRATSGPAAGKILIDPTNGLPLRAASFVNAGYDRQPDWTLGLTNTIRFKKLTASFLVDFRRGGDILNATQHFLTTRGLSTLTLDRERPRVIDGVLRDGRENSANPTPNTIVVVPAANTGYYQDISEELFIEKDIDWMRLRDVTVRYQLPTRWGLRNASVYVTGTDLFLLTNYSGLDPIVNGNTAAVGGSGAQGIDFGNFPIPRGINFGLRMGL